MDKEDFVSYKLALKLKACEFNEPCDNVYCKWFRKDTDIELLPKEKRDGRYVCADAPTLWQATKWLREKYGLHIAVYPCMASTNDQVCDEWQFWFFNIMQVSTARFLVDGEGRFNSYEEALSGGIKSALEIINKEK